MTEKFWGFQEPLSLQKFAVQASMGKSLLFRSCVNRFFASPGHQAVHPLEPDHDNNRCFLRTTTYSWIKRMRSWNCARSRRKGKFLFWRA